MSIVDSTYATLAEANTVNGEATPWDDTEDADKQTALEWATVYMDSTYYIPTQTTIPQVLINANSILANNHLSQSLFTTEQASKVARGLVESTVKADVVTSSKKYDPNFTAKWMDPFPDVTAMLLTSGFYIKKGGLAAAPLIRR